MRSRPAATRIRLVFLGLASCLWFLLIVYRLVDLQVIRHADLARRAERQQQRTLTVTPKRGVIYDRNRHELAVSIGVDSVYAVPSKVKDPAATARRLASVLSLDATAMENRLRSDRSFVWLKRKLDAAVARRVRELGLPGIYFEREHKRFYPKRELAAHVLGFVGVDENGLAGLEYSFDRQLRGSPQRLVLTADGRRRAYGRSRTGNSEGASLVLTLDENIQYIAERELAAAVESTHAASGSIIVQNPATGEILAMANYPSFNPNAPTAVPTFSHVNRSISLPYEPGSTFKVVTVAAALEERLTTPTEIIDCQMGGIVLAGHLIHDWKPFGFLSVREIVYHSSDVGAIKLGLRLGERKFYEHIRRWGFGAKTGIELPAESRGIVRAPENWSRISIGAVSMGQEIAITPVQLAAATSVVASGGFWSPPRVVREILGRDSATQVSSGARRRIIPVDVAEELRRMFAGVVTRGTGLLAQPRGYSVAGKTGTAQKIDRSGTYSRTDYIASFVGFAPVLNPAITVVVILDSPQEGGYHGGEVAAPVFARVTEQVLAYLNVPTDLPDRTPRRRLLVEKLSVSDFAPNRFAEPVFVSRTVAGVVPAGSGRAPATGSSGWEDSDSEGLLESSLRVGGQTTSIVTHNAESVEIPDFTGVSLRAVVRRCAALGLEPVLEGSGVAVKQIPAPGVRLPRGSRVRIQFRATLPKVPARSM